MCLSRGLPALQASCLPANSLSQGRASAPGSAGLVPEPGGLQEAGQGLLHALQQGDQLGRVGPARGVVLHALQDEGVQLLGPVVRHADGGHVPAHRDLAGGQLPQHLRRSGIGSGAELGGTVYWLPLIECRPESPFMWEGLL